MSDITKNPINRREALRRTALLLGGAVSAPTILGFMGGCSANAKAEGFQLLNVEQAKLVTTVSDIIIPTTDTPGAAAVGVPTYIDDMVMNMWDEEGRTLFLTNLEDFDNRAKQELGTDFNDASLEQQTAFVNAEHDRVFGGDVNWDAPRPFIWQMKELTISGYFSTEVGMTQVLQYIQVPGRFDACLPFEEAGGKVWAFNM